MTPDPLDSFFEKDLTGDPESRNLEEERLLLGPVAEKLPALMRGLSECSWTDILLVAGWLCASALHAHPEFAGDLVSAIEAFKPLIEEANAAIFEGSPEIRQDLASLDCPMICVPQRPGA